MLPLEQSGPLAKVPFKSTYPAYIQDVKDETVTRNNLSLSHTVLAHSFLSRLQKPANLLPLDNDPVFSVDLDCILYTGIPLPGGKKKHNRKVTLWIQEDD